MGGNNDVSNREPSIYPQIIRHITEPNLGYPLPLVSVLKQTFSQTSTFSQLAINVYC